MNELLITDYSRLSVPLKFDSRFPDVVVVAKANQTFFVCQAGQEENGPDSYEVLLDWGMANNYSLADFVNLQKFLVEKYC